jgi:hypothetical protein
MKNQIAETVSRNQKIKKLKDQKIKNSRNQEIKKSRNQEIKKSQFQIAVMGQSRRTCSRWTRHRPG